MKLKVGDKARVKQWDDMAKEGKLAFVNDMKNLCGTEVTISGVFNSVYRVTEADWLFNDEMLEPIEDYPLMENEEVWKWLGRNYLGDGIYKECFGASFSLYDLIEHFSFEAVVKAVSKYEHENEHFIPF